MDELTRRIREEYCKGLFPDEIRERVGVSINKVRGALKGYHYPYTFRVREEGWFVHEFNGSWAALNMFQIRALKEGYEEGLSSVYLMNMLQVSPSVFYTYLRFIKTGKLNELEAAYREYHGPPEDKEWKFDVPIFPEQFLESVPEEFEEAVLYNLKDGPVRSLKLRKTLTETYGSFPLLYLRSMKFRKLICCGVGLKENKYRVFWYLPKHKDMFFEREGLLEVIKRGHYEVDLEEGSTPTLRSRKDLYTVVPTLLSEEKEPLSSRAILDLIYNRCVVPRYLNINMGKVLFVLRFLRAKGVLCSEEVDGRLMWWLCP